MDVYNQAKQRENKRKVGLGFSTDTSQGSKMPPPGYVPQTSADCVICGAGFISREYLAGHFQRRHPNQLHLLHSSPQSNRQDRPVDHFAPMVERYGSIGGMHGDAYGASSHMGGAPFVGATDADPPMNEPMRGRGYAEHGRAGFHERYQRGPAGGHGGFGEHSGYGDARGGYGGGGYQGGGFGQPAGLCDSSPRSSKNSAGVRQLYKRKYEEMATDESSHGPAQWSAP